MTEKERNMLIGQRIKEVRTEKGLTLDDIANAMQMAKSTIQRYENAKIGKPKMPVIQSMAKVLNVSPSWLMGEPVPKYPHDADRFRQTAKAWNEAHPIKQKITETEFLLIKKFRALDERGQRAVMSTLETEYKYARKAKNEFLAAHGAVKLTEEQKREMKKWSDTDVEQ